MRPAPIGGPTRIAHVRERVPHAVYIGRPGPWGNPYAIGRDGNRAEVIAKHRARLERQLAAGEVDRAALAALHGRTLACYCAPLPCHGDTLAELAAREANAADLAPDTPSTGPPPS